MRNQLKHERLKPYYPVSVFHIAALLVCLVLVTTYLLSGAYSKFLFGCFRGRQRKGHKIFAKIYFRKK